MKRERFPPRTASCALETAKPAGKAQGCGDGSLQEGWSCTHTHTRHPSTSPRLWAASPQGQALPHKAGSALVPRVMLGPCSLQLPECVPKPSSTITIRQHSAFCNLMLLCPNLFYWKKTKACRFYDVNSEILGV